MSKVDDKRSAQRKYRLQKIAKPIAQAEAEYVKMLDQFDRLIAERKKLLQAGINYGTPNWRDGKLLRILKTSRDNPKRTPEYIGVDKKKQEIALAKLDRGKRVDNIDVALDTMMKTVDEAVNSLYEAADILKTYNTRN